ncbi:MAG: YgdI/YgdR family lipoprotein [Thermodesulfobacteriota bacterium]
MKRLSLLIVLTLTLILATACGSTLYQVSTNKGKEYIAVGKPDLNEKAQTYTFKDKNGNTVILNQKEVVEIKSIPGKY